MPRLRPAHGLFLLAIALLAFAAGLWVVRSSAPPPPPAWLEAWQREVFAPLADDRLNLGRLHAFTAGELWLSSTGDGPQLSYRAGLDGADGPWRMEAPLALSASERSSLEKATGVAQGGADQPLSGQLLAQLSEQPVAAVMLAPQQALSVGRLAVSFGSPRLRLQSEQGEAWIYPERGLTLVHKDGELLWLQVVPRERLGR